MGLIKDIDSEIVNLLYLYFEHTEESVRKVILGKIIEKIPFGYNPNYFIEQIENSEIRIQLRNSIGQDINYSKLLYDFKEYAKDSKNLMKGSYLVSRLSDSIFLNYEDYKKNYFLLVEEFLKNYEDFLKWNSVEQFKKICDFLYCYKGFQGNYEDYYNPENSFLTTIFETKKGIPVSLSVLTLIFFEILKKSIESKYNTKINFVIYGINLPGHFILAFKSNDYFTFFDPFNFGNQITYEDCTKYLLRHGFVIDPTIFQPTSTPIIVKRMLRNLLNHYTNINDVKKEVTIENILKILNNLF